MLLDTPVNMFKPIKYTNLKATRITKYGEYINKTYNIIKS